jgi:hypothetical protein
MKKTYLMLLFFATLLGCKKGTTEVEKKEVEEPVPEGHIRFSGYIWKVKNPAGTQNPHNNYWSKDNVWIDAQGHLHLRVRKNPVNNRWESAEVQTTIKLGYGTYQWKLEGPVNALDKNFVLGLFNYSGNSTYDEMDIEFSRWGHSNAKILNYSIWPATGENVPYTTWATDFTMTSNYTTHRWHRTANSLRFQSMQGFQDGNNEIIADKSWSRPITSISTLEMPVFMNFWLFKAVPPSDGKDMEIVIHEFKFTKL